MGARRASFARRVAMQSDRSELRMPIDDHRILFMWQVVTPFYAQRGLCHGAMSVRPSRYYAPVRREGGSKRCFCPSVRPSVAYIANIANNSRTQRPSVPKFGRMVPHLRRDSHTSFKVKRSKFRVIRSIKADTHRAPYLPNAKPYELQTWCTDGGRRIASAAGAMTSTVKGQGHKVTWSLWAVLAQWINKIGRRVPHDTCYSAHRFQGEKIKGHGHSPTNADT